MGALDGQHAFVTGGGSGIGLGAAQAFVADGATVTLCGRTAEKLAGAVEALGPAASSVVADVADEAQLAAAIEEANASSPVDDRGRECWCR